MIKAIIYDFDGTLVDTLNLHYKAYVYSLSKCGIKASRDEIIDKCFNKQDAEAAKSFGISAGKFSKYYRQRVIDDFKNVKLYPDVLSTFKLIDLPIAIGTSRNRKEIAPVLDKLRLSKYCDVIVTHDEVKKRKVDIFIKVCEYLKVKPSEIILVGDAETDLESANKMKAKSVLYYPNQHKNYYDLNKLKKYKPDFIIKNHKEIMTILQKLK